MGRFFYYFLVLGVMTLSSCGDNVDKTLEKYEALYGKCETLFDNYEDGNVKSLEEVKSLRREVDKLRGDLEEMKSNMSVDQVETFEDISSKVSGLFDELE